MFQLKLAKGHRTITVPSIILVLISLIFLIFEWYNSNIDNFGIIFILATSILLFFNLQFFRDPLRLPENGDDFENGILSPADGVLFEIDSKSEPGTTIYRIRMRFWDVHVNYMPLAGTLISRTKKRGILLPILPILNKYSKNRNARQTLIFQSPLGFKFKVIQISGTLAYRTVAYGKEQQFFEKGSKIGMIRYGSETDLHLPSDLTAPKVPIGTKIKSGKTILSEIKLSK